MVYLNDHIRGVWHCCLAFDPWNPLKEGGEGRQEGKKMKACRPEGR